MKKHIYLLMLAVLGMITSCGSDDLIESNTEQSKRVFTAETEMPSDTRTSLSPERNIYWTEGDHIAIFNKCTMANEYELNAGAGSPNGSFMEVTTSGDGGFISGTELSHVIAVYPHGKDYVATNASESSFKIENVVIPAEQTYVKNSFSQGSMPMVAVTSTKMLKFKNAGALIKLNVKSSIAGVGLSKITLESRSSTKEVISGKSVITVGNDGQNPSIKMKDGGSTMITLNCNNVKLSESTATPFYIALPAMNFASGFTITLYDDASHSMTLNSKASDIKRNQIIVMPTIVFKSSETPIVPTAGKWIDLGLPSGVKWASCNLGANSPEEYGNYYAWGETTTKTDYSEATYSYCKPNGNGGIVYEKLGDISGNAKYDAARANWGGTARMPTLTEIKELTNLKNCTWSWTTHNGVNGKLVTSKTNGNSIFLPAAGSRYFSSLEAGEYGYWSSTPNEDNDDNAYSLYFYADGYDWYYSNYRYGGRPVRPVQD